jgi:hypothetical protein
VPAAPAGLPRAGLGADVLGTGPQARGSEGAEGVHVDYGVRSGMVASLTRHQVGNGALAVAYRAQQLAHAYAVIYRVEWSAPEWAKQTIQNSLIESALSNARGVAYFFTRTSDVHFSMFRENWNDPVIKIAEKVEAPISRHLSHATKGAKEGEEHIPVNGRLQSWPWCCSAVLSALSTACRRNSARCSHQRPPTPSHSSMAGSPSTDQHLSATTQASTA